MKLGLVIYASLQLVLNPVAGVHQWDIEPNNLQIWIKVSLLLLYLVYDMICRDSIFQPSLPYNLRCDVWYSTRPYQ